MLESLSAFVKYLDFMSSNFCEMRLLQHFFTLLALSLLIKLLGILIQLAI